ncbi:hypothetical protein Rhopal_006511-T1 [Rhodotorula paludigena]|uniref:HNH nuclease domain-containing protein n=1 Tax=Rhodotorula paludigena TaxID=86838 RepID=A0AAV5GLH0_9BASI|nr:hypothetical protein Rhopal_006511-T1 [Rhodotorula paludigena]
MTSVSSDREPVGSRLGEGSTAATTGASLVNRVERKLQSTAQFTIWQYCKDIEAELGDAKRDSVKWHELTALLYRPVEHLPDQEIKLHAPTCALTGLENKPEAAHLVAAANEYADHQVPANKIMLAYRLHVGLDARTWDLLPALDAVLIRLLAEAAYQSKRLEDEDNEPTTKRARTAASSTETASTKLPARPPFMLFYERLESIPAVGHFTPRHAYRAKRLAWRDPLEVEQTVDYAVVRSDEDADYAASVELEGVPPVLLPASTNLLIYAMAGRIKQIPPAPFELRKSSSILADAVDLLLEFWNLKDTSNPAQLVQRAKTFASTLENPSAFGALFSANLSGISFDALPHPSLPSTHLDSRSPYTRTHAHETPGPSSTAPALAVTVQSLEQAVIPLTPCALAASARDPSSSTARIAQWAATSSAAAG